MIRARILEKEKEKAGVEITDEIIQKILEQMVKQHKDAADEYEKAGRNDVAAGEMAEAKIIQDYLPDEVSEEEINQAVDDAIAHTGASSMRDMGIVMGTSIGNLKKTGKLVDGNKVKLTVQIKLQAL
jgi:uncharacterized protein YqeY